MASEKDKIAAAKHEEIKANVERFWRYEISHEEFSAKQAELWLEIEADSEVREIVGELMLNDLRAARSAPSSGKVAMDKTISEHVNEVAEAHGLSDVFSRATSTIEGRVGEKAFALITVVGEPSEVEDLVEVFDALDGDDEEG